MALRPMLPLAAASILAAACGADDSPAAAQAGGQGFVTQPGDLGGSSSVIDHGGPNRGVQGGVESGAITAESFTPPTCSEPVALAKDVIDPAWSSEEYDAENPAPRGVHTSFRFDTATSLAVVWDTEVATRASWVAIGDSPDKLDRFVEGISFAYPIAEVDQFARPVRIHEAHVCGLEPNRTYYFAVGGDRYWGGVYAVKTAPAFDPSASWRLGVVGDSNHLFYDDFELIMARLGKETPDWIAFTGDMVHDGAQQSQWDKWFSAAGRLIAEAPTMTVHGNHEAMAPGYFGHFALPGNEAWFSFDYGQAHFLVLNDSPPDDAEFDVQAKFADDDLTAARARENPPVWIIAMHHRPPYSSAGSSLTSRAKFQPVFDAHHVDLVLNGHEHAYESTLPIKGDSTVVATPAEGTIYVTTGGAGAILNKDVTAEPWSRKYVNTFHYVVIDIDGKKLTLRAVEQDGTPIEEPIVIEK